MVLFKTKMQFFKNYKQYGLDCNRPSIDNLIPVYAMRWEIENLFQAFKGRGFNLEDTHLTDKNKIAKLIGLLCIAFVWIHKVGEYKDAKIKPIPRKKHGRLHYYLEIVVEIKKEIILIAKIMVEMLLLVMVEETEPEVNIHQIRDILEKNGFLSVFICLMILNLLNQLALHFFKFMNGEKKMNKDIQE